MLIPEQEGPMVGKPVFPPTLFKATSAKSFKAPTKEPLEEEVEVFLWQAPAKTSAAASAQDKALFLIRLFAKH